MLYTSECHQRWIPSGSDTTVLLHKWLESIGVFCQVIEKRKHLVGRRIKNKNYDIKISIKYFKGYRNVQKSIETSDDISVATLTHHILLGSELLNPVEWTQDHSANDLGLLIEECDGSR